MRPSLPEGPRAGRGVILVVPVRTERVDRATHHDSTNLRSVTIHGVGRECK